MSRALGDFWSWSESNQQYVVSPLPEVQLVTFQPEDSFLVLASDGLWDAIRPTEVISAIIDVRGNSLQTDMYVS
jgi:serine/threonine protein phosphatase PrpC